MSKLSSAQPQFAAVRIDIQRKYGKVPEDAVLSRSDTADAVAAFIRQKTPLTAFRAVYLCRCSVDPQLPKNAPDPWSILPRDDYEVARLHYLWESGEESKPLAKRLLQKDPNDAEVLSFAYW